MAEKKLKVKSNTLKGSAGNSKTAKASAESKKVVKTTKAPAAKKATTTKAVSKTAAAKKTVAKVSSKTASATAKQEGKVVQYAVGRRKRSVARVRMYEGDGSIIVNNKPIEEYAPSKAILVEILKPLEISGVRDGHSFTIKVIGGGIVGQLGAAKHGIARCIAKISEDMRKTMKQGGFLTRDPREKERKKVYHVRARKSPQYSKR